MANKNKNIINPKDILKYSRCGGFHGKKDSSSPTLNAEETCFGIYMYMLERMFNLSNLSNRELENPYLQSQVDMTMALISSYVLGSCVDRSKNTVTFSPEHFKETFGYFNLPNSLPLKDFSGVMPYITQYVLMQNGIRLDNENLLMNNNVNSFIKDEKCTRNNAHVYAKYTMKSINQKIECLSELSN